MSNQLAAARQRVSAYINRRKIATGLDIERVHCFDNKFDLLLSDLVELVAAHEDSLREEAAKPAEPVAGLHFRKKPVVIEAMQWDGSWDSLEAIKAKFPAMEVCATTLHPPSKKVYSWSVRTLEGSHQVSVGDWIIKGVKGEFYPCKPDIFAMTYDPAAAPVAEAAKPAEPVALSEKFADLRHYLNEAHQFAAMSPRGRDCIGIALDMVDELEPLYAAPVPEAAKPAEPFAWYDVEAGSVVDVVFNSQKPTYEGNWRPLYAAPVAVASQWQPIETAPKDGFVLVAGLSGYRGTPLRIAACEWSEDYDAWITHSHDRFTDGGNDAAWWMPLPPAPKEQA